MHVRENPGGADDFGAGSGSTEQDLRVGGGEKKGNGGEGLRMKGRGGGDE